MVNREDHHLVVGGTAKNLHPVERTLQKIEGLGKSLQRKLFKLLRRRLRRDVAKPDHRLAPSPNQLHRPVLSRQQRKPQNLLPINHPLQSGYTILRRDLSADVNNATDMVRYIRGRCGRRLPQLALRESYWM